MAAGYLLGSVCFGIVLAKRAGIDLRAIGSGNIGATNVRRALGARAGRTVMLLDALKGFAPVLVARSLYGADSPIVAGVAVAAVLGHCWPIWHGLRGGKGAATGAGVLLAATPLAGAAALLTFALLKWITGRASVGSLGGALLGLPAVLLEAGWGWRLGMAAAITGLVLIRHAENIRRLGRGEEPTS